ncbi:HVO_0234 family beta-propeller protein [Natrarchaeobaculum sulfurireducens]|uniref:HVO-0234-like beta-propeller domain-containing protein n=1 Tax=Natrarchaeobaculum sulfurireducens TaxID=2044521 RepID=A0A346PLJ2_9EURY|nr:hypothetical protein [Natrarchaeobaculum sulfurireducens]AXR76716.1 hypothetical protein AArc1_0372 [Natrarchaeobaculum sulfurireducens]AXR80387.1 hypothetical protein AArcMg_0364 [Natrarchaeobaculum sulfurireducens]
MQSIEEKRVYGDRTGAVDAYVACSIGVVRVHVADDAIGEFSLRARCDARDLAATDDALAVATDEDVRILALEEGDDGPAFVETGFGPAVAVGADGSDLLAADETGRVARRRADEDGWERLTDEPFAAVNAIDGSLVGTESGVYRVHGGDLDHAGLTDVRDVAAASVPLAATADGLYKLGNGWMAIRDGPFDVVASSPGDEYGRLERAHAVADEAVTAYDGEAWRTLESPDGRIVDVAYGEPTYAVTADGTFLVASDDPDSPAWRRRSLGVDDARALALAPTA